MPARLCAIRREPLAPSLSGPCGCSPTAARTRRFERRTTRHRRRPSPRAVSPRIPRRARRRRSLSGPGPAAEPAAGSTRATAAAVCSPPPAVWPRGAAQPVPRPARQRRGVGFLSAPVHTLAGMSSLSAARLDEMIEQATVDCYDDSEQVCGLFTLLEDALAVPFETSVLGLSATVTGVDLTVDDRIVALVRRAGERQRIP